MKLNNPQGIATTCSQRYVQSVLEDCKAVMKECEYWIWQYTNSPNDVQVRAGLEKCLKALKGEL